jgi:hypothetical protein
MTLMNEFSTLLNIENYHLFNDLYRRPFAPVGYYALGILVGFSYFEYTLANSSQR